MPCCKKAEEALIQYFAKNRVAILTVIITGMIFSPVVPALSIKSRASFRQTEITKKAEEMFQQAQELCNAGDQAGARDLFAQALRWLIEIRETKKAAQASLLMGDSYRRMKRFQEALDYYQKGLEIGASSNQLRANAFNCIAKLYLESYNFELSKKYFLKAIHQARLAEDIPSQADALGGLAALCYQSGERDVAIDYIAQARQLNHQLGNDDLEAMLLHLTGRIAQEQGAKENSRKALKEALSIYQRTGNVGEQVKVLSSISDLCLSSGQNEQALESSQQAVEMGEAQAKRSATLADIRRSREWRWRAYLAQGRALRVLGRKAMAVKSYRLAISHLEAIWISSTSATDIGAVAFGEERQAPCRELADLLIEQGQIEGGFQVAEQARSRTLSSLIAARRGKPPQASTGQSEMLRAPSRAIASLRTRLLSPEISAGQRVTIEKEIEESESALLEEKAKFDMNNSKERLLWFRPASVEQVQENLGQDKKCVAEFLLGKKRSFLWLISSNNVFVEILPDREQIEKAVEQYLGVISVRPNNLYLEKQVAGQREMSEKLFGMLFGGLADHLVSGTKLIVAPDGILNYLPFEAMIHSGRYLIEDHEISYLPSASMLGLLQGSRGRTAALDKMELLAIGDPSFMPKGSREKRRASHAVENEQTRRAANGFNLSRLPRTRDEVQEIGNLFNRDRTRILLDKDSTEDAVKAESLRRYRRIHFATHALIEERNPSQSAIVLTLDQDPQEDGFLEASEITDLDLDCDLVVLSACQTGRGQLSSGEGILGLPRAFLYAGARSVVVSLWNVSDISTSQLMKNFYQRLVSEIGNTAALREAKLQMIRTGRETQHPYYWAPFIIVGKP